MTPPSYDIHHPAYAYTKEGDTAMVRAGVEPIELVMVAFDTALNGYLA
jgi:hypothetical protein